ncbi:MAG: AAA family ATPase [Elusimicrobia bacterium]|nr:AAA family ATPase [Elusimicrobiota bacterium]
MHKQHWSLKSLPFENTPDPDFFFESEEHAEAVSRMGYVLQSHKVCGVLTGVYGCGKTLVMHSLRRRFEQEGYKFALVTNPRLSEVDILRMILYGLSSSEIPTQKGDILMCLQKTITEINNDGKHPVIVIDEAHAIENNMVFEELRLLLNFQTDNRVLVTLLLSGQPELKGKLESNKQFNQRVSMKYYLGPFNQEDTVRYIQHRLSAAGAKNQIFTDEALEAVFQRSGGIPRWINNICHMAMMAAFSADQKLVTPEMVKEAVETLDGTPVA